MRLRNIPGAGAAVASHLYVVKGGKQYRGKWGSIFTNQNPICIEIGMGKGQFLLNLAKRNPEINYIGLERYASVLLRGLERLEEEEFKELTNVKFLCLDARELEEVFAPGEVERIYLNFSDPWPKARHKERRLTSVSFLEKYQSVLKERGEVEFKTDNRDLFDFSLIQAKKMKFEIRMITYDLHNEESLKTTNVMTEYEEKFSSMGNPICKMILCKPS